MTKPDCLGYKMPQLFLAKQSDYRNRPMSYLLRM